MKYKYIAIEGPIGVGKTQFAHMLGHYFGARLVVDDQINNPFLEKFYENPELYAFQCQVFSLFQRYHQLQFLHQYDLFHQIVVADFLFEREKLYAAVTLTESELALYNKIYGLLCDRVPRPDLVIVLQMSWPLLLKRLKKLEREEDYSYNRKFVQNISQAYSNYFYHYNSSPLIVLNLEKDIAAFSKDDLMTVIRHIEHTKGGRTYVTTISGPGSEE
ncbi:deoxynucleoside kinase [bacterium]|nr:deoxynucleoside kinase [bacterium]